MNKTKIDWVRFTPPLWSRYLFPWRLLRWIDERFNTCWASMAMWAIGHYQKIAQKWKSVIAAKLGMAGRKGEIMSEKVDIIPAPNVNGSWYVCKECDHLICNCVARKLASLAEENKKLREELHNINHDDEIEKFKHVAKLAKRFYNIVYARTWSASWQHQIGEDLIKALKQVEKWI